MDRAAEIEQFFGQRRLARVGVGDDRKGTPVGHRRRVSVCQCHVANLVFRFAAAPSRSCAKCEQPCYPRAVRDSEKGARADRSEEHTSELQSLMRNSYAVFCLNK